ncbi:MAG TPA: hypothetical protein VMW76_03305 [Bacteroidales bacterium]|nr:hypothetical protein [Bacteroidales bacterium]
MKSHKLLLIAFAAAVICIACKKTDEHSERFNLLTGHVWVSDSLLVDGNDASGPGGLLEKFAGDAEFKEDGTGYFGQYEGTWYFSNNEIDITITSDSLAFPLTSRIIELAQTSFKITTSYPSPVQGVNFAIRITFKSK